MLQNFFLRHRRPEQSMGKRQLTRRNLGRVFNFRNGRVHVVHLLCNRVKLPILKLKIRPKQLLGSLPLDIVFPARAFVTSKPFLPKLLFAGKARRLQKSEQVLHSFCLTHKY